MLERAKTAELEGDSVHPQDADLYFYRFQLRHAAVRADPACSRLVAQQRCGPDHHRLVLDRLTALYVEISLVSVDGSFFSSLSGKKEGVGANHADRLISGNRFNGAIRPVPVVENDRIAGVYRVAFFSQPGHCA